MSTRGWVLFIAMSLVWGVPYLFIRVALEEGASPALVAWGRVVIAAAVLLPVAWRLGALRGLRDRWRAVLAFSVIEIVVPFPLIAAGQVHVSSSLAAILIATVPLMVALLALRFDADERAAGLRLAGLLVGLAGVAVLLGVDVAGRLEEVVGAAFILVASAGYAVGAMMVKHRFGGLDPVGPVAGSLGVAAVLLAPLALLAPPEAMPAAAAFGSIVVLGVLCSAVALVAYFALIAEVGPGRATVITYVNPLVAVVLGVVLLGERVGVASLAGLGLIVGGSWLATRRAAAGAPAPA
jgi:drug/metabolite transporter (DMT)-like permease